MDPGKIKELLSIVLVNPKRSPNVGAAARAMNCMGIRDLVLVSPRCQIDRFAFNIATGSGDILEQARIFPTLHDSLKGYGLIMGTTRREGKRRYNVLTPSEMAMMLWTHFPARTAILFGPEDNGLSREQLDRCQYLVTIPTNDDFGSLNLAQAVMTICYEIHRALSDAPAEKEKNFNEENITAAELETMCTVIEETLTEIRYTTRRNIDDVTGHLKEIFSRASLRRWELDMVLGIMRHLRFMENKIRGHETPGQGAGENA
jgi:tRNA/rRNA methyltransferase